MLTALKMLAFGIEILMISDFCSLFFGCCAEKSRLDSATRLTQGPTLHHMTRGTTQIHMCAV
jgi:hypothetical protein